MDSMNNSTGSMSMSTSMTPWLHFGNTDHLLFQTWQPSSHAAVGGACFGLFLFSIMERCLGAYRRTQESHWRTKAILMSSGLHACDSKEEGPKASRDGSQRVAPFIPSHDIPRGVLQAIQSTFAYTLMLVVMSYNGAYILSVILGLGVGEVLFGRFGPRHDV
ncbi:Ctr copper transporter [Imleria badia]|nr:Ctr copper transporter [Imleria badia]